MRFRKLKDLKELDSEMKLYLKCKKEAMRAVEELSKVFLQYLYNNDPALKIAGRRTYFAYKKVADMANARFDNIKEKLLADSEKEFSKLV